MSLNLYQEMRPETFDEVVGQDVAVKTLQKASKIKSLPQTILLLGKSGTGKTTLVRLIGKVLSCTNLREDGNPCNECDACKDINNEKFQIAYKEYSGTDMNIDKMREVVNSTETMNPFSPVKIIFIDELQEMAGKGGSLKAMKDLLDITEKKKKGVYFILAAMDETNLPDALKDRGMTLRLKQHKPELIFKYLVGVCEYKGIKVEEGSDKHEVISILADTSHGSMRAGLSRLESCILGDIWTPKEVAEELNLIGSKDLAEIVKSICSGDIKVLADTFVTQDNLGLLRWIVTNGYKRIAGVELDYWKKEKTKSLIGLNLSSLEILMTELNETLKYNYLTQDIIDYHLLQATIKNKKPVTVRKPING